MYQQPVSISPPGKGAVGDGLGCDLCESTDREWFARSNDDDGDYYRCRGCGLIYAIADAEALPALYDNTYHERYADRIAADRNDRPGGSWRWEQKAARRLAAFEAYRKNATFLEIGCSLGDFLNVVSRSGWDAVGIEISEAAANYARNRWGLDVRTGTLETVTPEMAPGSFDVIWAANLLEHVVSPKSFLANVERLLRPGGVLIASTLNFASWAFQFSGSRWQYLHSARMHRYVFSPELLERYCRANGLEIQKVRTTGFRWVSKLKDRTWYSPAIRFFEQCGAHLARVAHKGHRIEIWARKPGEPNHAGISGRR